MFEEKRTKQTLSPEKRTCRQQHPYFKIVNYNFRSLSYQSPAVFFNFFFSAIVESLIKAVVVSAKGKV